MTLEDLDKIVSDNMFRGEKLEWINMPIFGAEKLPKQGQYAFAQDLSWVIEKWQNEQKDTVVYYKENPRAKGLMLCVACDSEVQQETPIKPIYEFPRDLAGYGNTKRGESLPYCETCEEKPYSGAGLKNQELTIA